MRLIFNILTVISVVFMVLFILLQSRGAGLGASFGGESNFYRSRRGGEKVIYQGTIVTAIIFVLSVVLGILSKS